MSDADELRRIAQNDYRPVAWGSIDGKYLPDGELLLAIADRLEKDPSPAIPKDADELRRIAQNDYMIDGKYLPDGELLLAIADRIEEQDEQKALKQAAYAERGDCSMTTRNECRRDRDGYCWHCQAGPVDQCPGGEVPQA